MLSKTHPNQRSKAELQDLAENKLLDIKALFYSDRYDAVNDQSGYVIEYALKATVCKALNCDGYPYPPNRDYQTHDLTKLVSLANVDLDLNSRLTSSKMFFDNWMLLSGWKSEYRYLPIGTTDKEKALDIIIAIDHQEEGVYPWVKSKW